MLGYLGKVPNLTDLRLAPYTARKSLSYPTMQEPEQGFRKGDANL